MKSLCLTLAGLLLLVSGCSKEARVERHEDRAASYFAAGEYAKAEIEYKNVLSRESTNVLALRRLGEIHQARGMRGQAYAMFDRALQIATNDVNLRFLRAESLVGLGAFAAARPDLEAVIRAAPETPGALPMLVESYPPGEELDAVEAILRALEARAGGTADYHVALGNLYLRRNDAASAQASFERALSRDSKSVRAHLGMGVLHLLRQQGAEADREFKTAAGLAPARSTQRLRYAEFKKQSGAIDEARTLLQAAVKETPDYVPALLSLAQLELEAKNHEATLAAMTAVLALDPSNHDARLIEGNLFLGQRELTKAEATFRQLTKVFPDSYRAHYQLAVTLLAQGDNAGALLAVNRALELAPGYTTAQLVQANLNIRLGNAREAIDPLLRLIRREPGHMGANALLGDAYRMEGRRDEAVAVYRSMAEAQPTNAQPWFLLGLTLKEQGKSAEARQSLEQALELTPGSSMISAQLIDLDLAEQNFSAALARAQALADQDPKRAVPWLMTARIHALQKNNEQAEAALQKAVELEPDSPAGYRALAQFYAASGQKAQALERLETLAAKNPGDTMTLLQIAQIHHESKDASKAAETYDRILKIDPANFPALNNLAFLCAEDLNDLNRAYDLARKAHDLRPQDSAAADTLGWILVKRGEIPAGLTLLQDSSSKAPDDSEKAYHLGVAHYLLGEEAQARVNLDRAVKQSQDFAGRQDAERRLQVLSVAADDAGPEVTANLERYVAAEPSDTVAIFRLAAVRERSGQPAQAKALYEQALKQQPKNANAMLRLARVEADGLKNQARAIELMNQALQLAPNDPRVAQLSSRIAFGAGDYRRALSLAQEAARALPRDPAARYDLALANYAVGNPAEALTDARNSLAMGSEFDRAAEAQTFVSMLEIQQSPTTASDGLAKVQEVLKKRPNDVAAQMAEGALLESQADHAAAKVLYERILTQNPIFVPAMRRLGYVLAHSAGDPAPALKRAQELASGLPGDPDLGKVVGVLQFRAGDAAAAIRTLAPIATQRQNDGELLFYLGMSQAQAGDKAPAQASLTRALTLNLPSNQADAARKRLEELK